MSSGQAGAQHREQLATFFEKEHRAIDEWAADLEDRERGQQRLDTRLGLATMVLAGAAAVNVPTDALGEWFTACSAAAAAMLAAAQQYFRPAQKAREHADRAAEARALASDHQTLGEHDMDRLDDAELERRGNALRARKIEFERRAGAPPRRRA